MRPLGYNKEFWTNTKQLNRLEQFTKAHCIVVHAFLVSEIYLSHRSEWCEMNHFLTTRCIISSNVRQTTNFPFSWLSCSLSEQDTCSRRWARPWSPLASHRQWNAHGRASRRLLNAIHPPLSKPSRHSPVVHSISAVAYSNSACSSRSLRMTARIRMWRPLQWLCIDLQLVFAIQNIVPNNWHYVGWELVSRVFSRFV